MPLGMQFASPSTSGNTFKLYGRAGASISSTFKLYERSKEEEGQAYKEHEENLEGEGNSEIQVMMEQFKL